MYKNSARHTLIINDIFEDLKTHQCIVIPMDRIQAEQKLVNDINNKQKDNFDLAKLSYTKKLRISFVIVYNLQSKN